MSRCTNRLEDGSKCNCYTEERCSRCDGDVDDLQFRIKTLEKIIDAKDREIEALKDSLISALKSMETVLKLLK